MLVLIQLSIIVWLVGGTVLDPALYLSPSPPMSPTQDDIPNEWALPRQERDTDLFVVPIEQIKSTTIQTTEVPKTVTTLPSTKIEPDGTTILETTSKTTEQDEMMDKAETIWPSVRTTGPYFGIHVPLTFSLTGTYGRYGTSGVGVIGSSYASVSDTDTSSGLYQLYGKAALAGSSYGSYSGIGSGTRIYGNGGKAGWSGWGNGKWGHYGKG